MKKTIKPASREEAVYYSDFSGKCFGEFYPEVNIKIEFNYGSKYDGSTIELHLTDEEASFVLEPIKANFSEDFKSNCKKQLESYEEQYEQSMQMRDWDSCDMISNMMWFWRDFLGLSDEKEQEE